MPERSEVVTYLVHGTWAKGSRWPQIEEEIRRQLPDTDHVFDYPTWSGKNTVKSRLSGALSLERRLLDSIRRKPDAHHFIIAHSHGGNVSLLALKNPEVRAAISGIVCLSTPFLLCRPRILFRDLTTFPELIGLVGVVALLMSPFYYFAQQFNNILVFFAGIPVLVPAYFLAQRWQRASRAFLEEIRFPDLQQLPLFIIRSPSDEASLTLGACQAASKLVSVLWSFACVGWIKAIFRISSLRDGILARYVARPLFNLLALWLLVGVLYFILSFIAGRNPWSSQFETILVTPAFYWYPLTLVILAVAVAAVLPTLFLMAIVLIPYGPRFAVHAPFVEVSAEGTPEARRPCQVVQLGWLEEGFIAIDSLAEQHGSTHDHPIAINLTVDWIKKQIDGQAIQSPISSSTRSRR